VAAASLSLYRPYTLSVVETPPFLLHFQLESIAIGERFFPFVFPSFSPDDVASLTFYREFCFTRGASFFPLFTEGLPTTPPCSFSGPSVDQWVLFFPSYFFRDRMRYDFSSPGIAALLFSFSGSGGGTMNAFSLFPPARVFINIRSRSPL